MAKARAEVSRFSEVEAKLRESTNLFRAALAEIDEAAAAKSRTDEERAFLASARASIIGVQNRSREIEGRIVSEFPR